MTGGAPKWSVISGKPKHLVCLTARNSRRNMSETSLFVANQNGPETRLQPRPALTTRMEVRNG